MAMNEEVAVIVPIQVKKSGLSLPQAIQKLLRAKERVSTALSLTNNGQKIGSI